MGSENLMELRGGGAHSLFKKIISTKNLFGAWREFQKGKMRKDDVLAFAERAEYHLLKLHHDLANGAYRHGQYIRFFVHDPKRREISKASVRDRVLHHAICRVITPIFDARFIFDSYSSRKGKGTLAAINRFEKFAWKLSRNNTRTVWVLKCDVRKFFDSVDHDILTCLLGKYILCPQTLNLLRDVVQSFEIQKGKGIPLGNLTSQLFSNAYLDCLDQYVKRALQVKHYVRYADDMFALNVSREYLEEIFSRIKSFAREELELEFHKDKIIFQKWHQGVDALGYVSFPYHRILRTKTKQRMFRKISVSKQTLQEEELRQIIASYKGRLKHCHGQRLEGLLQNQGFRVYTGVMEKAFAIKQETGAHNAAGNLADAPKREKENPDSAAHKEAIEFVEKHRDFLEHYARGKIKFEPAPEGLDTFAFNLETDTIYVNSRFYKKLGFSDEKTSFATLHEAEHFLEKKQILSEEGGERVFERYLKRVKESEAYSHMDNCVADIRENEAVAAKTTKDFGEIETKVYKEDLFKETDLTSEPNHLQFCDALLRESRVPDENCVVSPEAREKLDQLKGMKNEDGESIFDIITHPDVPMSSRLALQNEYLWPIVKELLEEDMKKKKKGKEGKEKVDPNKIFKDAYERAKKRTPNATPTKEIEKAFKEWQKAKSENPLDKADREYGDKTGVKKEDLLKYRDFVRELEKIKNPETNISVAEELRNLISKIISQRMKPAVMPKYPMEEGEELVDPAELVSQVKVGNLEPKVWESYEIKERKGQKFGEVEITLVCDRSGSMTDGDSSKLAQQQKAATLMMEALKEFAELCDEERVNMEKPLEVRSEIYSFQSDKDKNDSIPLKKMSKELGEKERIDIFSILSSAPGSTTDFAPLEAIANGINEEILQKIDEGELKKIVIVFTDGESDDVQKVERTLKVLRQKKVIVIGVGITEEGRAALDTYAPDARLAETAEKLPIVLGDLLKDHLNDI